MQAAASASSHGVKGLCMAAEALLPSRSRGLGRKHQRGVAAGLGVDAGTAPALSDLPVLR